MTIFFTSDTHFGHKNILKYSNRPFKTIEEHDEELVRRWNVLVQPDDTIYHLGDFSFAKRDRTEEIGRQLNGHKHLIFGNHDKAIRGAVPKLYGFETAQDYKEIKIWDEEMDLKQVICMFHYPIESWNKRHHGSFMLHGHCHGSLPSPDHQARVDVGVDVWSYAPVSYEEIKEHMTRKVLKPIDHHISR